MPAPSSRPWPTPRDQAHGLRQLFAGAEPRFVPLVHNPQVPGAGAVMERLCAAFAGQGHHTLVVDAADSASPPHELATVDLSACVERLSSQVSYLAARGLAMHYLDNRATLTGFLDALRGAAPHADLVLLHAGALDLRRMFVGRAPSPVLMVSHRAETLTHAYTSMKLLSQRLGVLAYDLVLVGDVAPRRARCLADRLTECADHFLGAALRHLAVLDPLAPPQALLSADLIRLAAAQAARQALSPVASAPAGLLSMPAPPGAQRQGQAAGRMN